MSGAAQSELMRVSMPHPDKAALLRVLRQHEPALICHWPDLFDDHATDEWIAVCFGVMAATTRHVHLVRMPSESARWFLWYEGESGAGAYPFAAVRVAAQELGEIGTSQLLVALRDGDEDWPPTNVIEWTPGESTQEEP